MRLTETLSKRKKYIIYFIALAVSFVLLKMTVFAPPEVKIVTVEKRDLSAQVYGNGTVEAKVVVGISSKITGKIIQLYADQGDHVRKGQLLVKLENDDFIQQQAQSEAEVGRADATLNVEMANLKKAKANLELAENNVRRYRDLVGKNLVSKLEAEQYENTYQVAKEEVSRSTAAVESARMGQKANQAGLGVARSKVADTFIYAPQDGVIISRDMEKGATVTPGMSIFRLADPQTVWVKANVDESQMKGVAVGRKAIISLRSAPGVQFPGLVLRIGRESDRVTEESEVDVAFTQALKDFRLGEQADVHIITEGEKGVLSIPSATLVSKGKIRGVFLVEKGKLKFREITIGIEDAHNFTEVLAGLTDGDRIAMAPQQEMMNFKEGMKVKVMQ